MDPNRRIRQPGPAAPERVQFAEGRGAALAFDLDPGLNLVDAIHRPLARAGYTSAVLELEGGAFGPFTYVIPSLPQTPEHAAFYSDPVRPTGLSHLSSGAVTFGRGDAGPFLHCHAFWSEVDGMRHGGHVIPTETVVAEAIRARAWALDGIGFATASDPETNFTLFGPVPEAADSSRATTGRAFGLRLRPNQDICGALEAFCRDHRIPAATVRGGVASIIGAVFEDGTVVRDFATEMFVRAGQIGLDGSGEPRAQLDVALVTYTGACAEGRLRRGANPVLMTAELALEVAG